MLSLLAALEASALKETSNALEAVCFTAVNCATASLTVTSVGYRITFCDRYENYEI